MGQARGQVLSKTPEGRMKEEQRLKINQGVQSGESLLRAETCLDKMTICQMTASGPVRFSQPPSPPSETRGSVDQAGTSGWDLGSHLTSLSWCLHCR